LLSEKIPQWDLNTFIKEVTDDNSEFNKEILEKGKRISSLRHIGIKKTKLVSSPKSPIEKNTIDTETETEINKEPEEDTAKAT
jgi:small subunit ribosomal protein S3Ae